MNTNACEVWVARLSDFSRHQAELDRLLTEEERAHVHRFRTQGTTVRTSRALLRLVLAGYLDLPPDRIEIDRSCPTCDRPHGKPRLLSGVNRPAPGLQFSVAHGGDLLVLAFAEKMRVGVDVEPTGPQELATELLEFALTPSELQALREAPPHRQHHVFAQKWTGKEAVLKALGTGLVDDLHQLSLPPLPVGGVTPVRLAGLAPTELWLKGVDVGSGHVCTLATGSEVRDMRVVPLAPTSLS